jgi:hypothetical protein
MASKYDHWTVTVTVDLILQKVANTATDCVTKTALNPDLLGVDT